MTDSRKKTQARIELYHAAISQCMTQIQNGENKKDLLKELTEKLGIELKEAGLSFLSY